MISLPQVLKIHERTLLQHGGADGIKDLNALKSAIARPFQTFGGEDLYPSPAEKAAAILESIVQNHPFVDGNKRTGFILMLFILKKEGFNLNATQIERYEFVTEVASGNHDKDSIKDWLEPRLIHKNT